MPIFAVTNQTNAKTKMEKKDIVYMELAKIEAKQSEDGCVILTEDGHYFCGHSQTPEGISEEYGKYLVHAEEECIAKCARYGLKTDGATAYLTSSPCVECAKIIIQAGIRKVVYNASKWNDEGLGLLRECNIEVSKYEE